MFLTLDVIEPDSEVFAGSVVGPELSGSLVEPPLEPADGALVEPSVEPLVEPPVDIVDDPDAGPQTEPWYVPVNAFSIGHCSKNVESVGPVLGHTLSPLIEVG